MRYAGMWPVDERDFITSNVNLKQSPNKYYMGTSSCNYPIPIKNKVVRGDLNLGGYIL